MTLMITWKDALPWKTPHHQGAQGSCPEIASLSSGKIEALAMKQEWLLTSPWGHIFLNIWCCSLISASVSEVFFCSAAIIAPSPFPPDPPTFLPSFLLFLTDILTEMFFKSCKDPCLVSLPGGHQSPSAKKGVALRKMFPQKMLTLPQWFLINLAPFSRWVNFFIPVYSMSSTNNKGA